MIAIPSPQTEFDDGNSSRGVTLEWIQTLPQELKDEALLRLIKGDVTGTPLGVYASFTHNLSLLERRQDGICFTVSSSFLYQQVAG